MGNISLSYDFYMTFQYFQESLFAAFCSIISIMFFHIVESFSAIFIIFPIIKGVCYSVNNKLYESYI